MKNICIPNYLRGLASVSVFLMCLTACGSKSDIPNSEEKQVTSTEEETVEHQIAAIDAGGFIAKDDITVTRARYLLSSIQSATDTPARNIGNMAAKTSDLLMEKYGKKVTILEVLEAVNASEQIHNRSINLSDFLALYIVSVGS